MSTLDQIDLAESRDTRIGSLSEKRRVRVLQFLTSKVRAGAEEVALELARGLDPQRFESYIACPQPLLDAFGEDCAAVHTLPLECLNLRHIRAAWQFIRYLRAEHIDIVHAHMIRAAAVAIPLARLAGTPVVIQTCHGREAWRDAKGNSYWIDRRLHDLSDATIAVSKATGEHLLTDKRLSKEKVFVIPNGRDLKTYQPDTLVERALRSEFGIENGAIIIAVFGRLEEQKGHTYLLDALPRIVSWHPNLRVLLVGDGTLRQALKKQAADLGVERTVIFAGYRADWRDLLHLCEFVVLPSLYEGMPLVLIEAGAMGKPVVATAVDGSTEVVLDGSTGILVPARDTTALADAIIRMASDSEVRPRMGTAARERACSMFSLEEQIRRSAQLYEQLLGKRCGGRR